MNDETAMTPRRGRPPSVKIDENSSETASSRVEMRAEPRKDDPRARAAQRAAEIRGHRTEESLDENDRFKINKDDIPAGWSYEWKRKSVMGKEDPAHEVELARGGWEPVPASRHSGMMPKGKYETIERDGMILMERPKELTDEVHQNNLRRARLQVRHKEAQLTNGPDGTFERANPVVKKSFEAMPIKE
jgi:hypothetical protein